MAKTLTKTEANELLREWKDSGMTGTAFSREKGIVRSTLYYWSKQMEKVEDTNRMGSGFCELMLNDIIDRGSIMSIRYPNGVEIRLRAGYDINYVKSLTTC